MPEDANILAILRAARDWPQDAGHENGRYTCQCVECGLIFTGHKRRVVCRSCAVPSERS